MIAVSRSAGGHRIRLIDLLAQKSVGTDRGKVSDGIELLCCEMSEDLKKEVEKIRIASRAEIE